jgi:hypothetical protein
MMYSTDQSIWCTAQNIVYGVSDQSIWCTAQQTTHLRNLEQLDALTEQPLPCTA